MAKKQIIEVLSSVANTLPLGLDMIKRGKLKLLKSFMGPAYNGIILQRGKNSKNSSMRTDHDVFYDWTYESSNPEIECLYRAGKVSQWNVSTDLDWSVQVDPLDIKNPIIPDRFCPAAPLPMWQKLTP